MKNWNINFINQSDFKIYVKNTIDQYLNTASNFGEHEFFQNKVDPIKMTFDTLVYNKSISEFVEDEKFRQIDKSNNNTIGFFNQNIFKLIKNCEVPKQGFDVICKFPDAIFYCEFKNKFNTMNSSSANNTYMKFLSEKDKNKNDNDVYFLVEIISKTSHNTIWKHNSNDQNYTIENIRKISIDQFYYLVTGDKFAFKKICDSLPIIIEEIMNEEEYKSASNDLNKTNINKLTLKSFYQESFISYLGFDANDEFKK